MAFRRRIGVVVAIVTLMFIMNRLVFTVLRDEMDKNLNSESERLQLLQKEKSLAKVRRISENFAPYQNKRMPSKPVSGVTQQEKNYNITSDTTIAKDKHTVRVTIDRHAQSYDNINFNSEDSYKLYFRDTEQEDIQDPFVNLHRFEYKIRNEFACNGDVLAVIMVNSSPEKVKERMQIRDTWASVRFYLGASIVPLFMLAQRSTHDKLQEDIVKESQTYQDIVQGNFVDSYKNLTYKTVMGLHWVQHYCNHTKFVLKVDDDTMVDVYHLVKFLFQKSPDGNMNQFLYCSVYRNQGPVRDTSSKWFVPTHEYPYAKYPPYCEGFAYIMSNDVTRLLYQSTARVKTYWIDDVYVSGLVAHEAGIKHHEMESGHGYNLMQSEHLAKHVQTSLFLLAKYDHLRPNWDDAWSDIKTIHNI